MRRVRVTAAVRAAVLVSVVALACSGRARSGPAAGGERAVPLNALILTIDSLRADHLGFMGYPLPTSPVLDELARHSIVFEHARSPGTWTSPSLISLFTSLFPPAHGVEGRGVVPSPRLHTPVEAAQEAGYAAFGYTLGENYENLGFAPIPDKDLVRLLRNREQGPFLAWMHLRGPHLPYSPPMEVWRQFWPGGTAPSDEVRARLRRLMAEPMVFKGSWTAVAGDAEWIRSLYDAEVKAQDEAVGEILRVLAEQRLDERTLVVVTSDHGEELLDHGYIGHASTSRDSAPYEELLRVPLLVHIPGYREGARVGAGYPVGLEDVLPTVLAAIGVKIPRRLHGRNLLPLVENPREWRNRPMCARATPCGWQCENRAERRRNEAVVDGAIKLLRRRDESGATITEELYDLSRDPGEHHALPPHAVDASEIKRLRAILDRWGRSARWRPAPRPWLAPKS
ncbi:MAG: sulfatase-like hydrolase/transferase [Candidatus Schekmanbacteria bacterium]|nr:sulfatase-like hydrolase/transferase [Candidatus Schekmanbacteria bacterium]